MCGAVARSVAQQRQLVRTCTAHHTQGTFTSGTRLVLGPNVGPPLCGAQFQCDDVEAIPHFISFHFISFHFISFHFISFHFISFHFISFHFISFHFISFHFISFHFISFHFISFHFISFHFISFHFISFHFISFHFISFHFISFHFISFHSFISFIHSGVALKHARHAHAQGSAGLVACRVLGPAHQGHRPKHR